MIPMEIALSKIASSLLPLTPATVPLSQSLGLILSRSVSAPRPLPAFRASVKDGYALCHTPFPSSSHLRVIGESIAGSDPHALRIQPGTAVYVTTGAPVPPGADAVVMVEHTEKVNHNEIRVAKWPDKPGLDVRQVGSDVAQGEQVLAKGALIGAAELGILAGCGISSVDVITRPKVGVVSTGDELVDVVDLQRVLEDNAGKLPPGKIVDSNRPMLLAAVREHLPFADAVDLGLVKDEYALVRDAMRDALEQCHIVLTSGGVSMGNRDVIKPVLEELAEVHFGRVIMKPGKPLTYATVPGKNRCFIALPGNPVSAFVCFHLAVTVAAKTLAGWSRENAMGDIVEVTVRYKLHLDKERPEYHRAVMHVRCDALFCV